MKKEYRLFVVYKYDEGEVLQDYPEIMKLIEDGFEIKQISASTTKFGGQWDQNETPCCVLLEREVED